MKKLLSALVLGAGLCAAMSTTTWAQTLRVGTHPTFAPFEFVDSDGKAIGFDLDVINAIAKVNGDEVQIESMPFDGLIPSILTGNLDLIISGMTITDERKKRVDFSHGYYNSKLSIIIKKDKANEYTSADSLKGKTICVQIGTTGHAFADKVSPGNVKALNNEPDAILELTNGGCEAVINDSPVNLYYLQKANLDTLIDFVDPQFEEQADVYGIAMRKGNEELLNKINSGLEKITASGELDAIHLKWFGQDTKGRTAEQIAAEQAAAETPAAATAADAQ